MYYLTEYGFELRKRFGRDDKVDIDSVDWNLYGWACFRHRTPVLKAVSELMSPPMIYHRLRMKNEKLRISRNNVTDIIRLLHQRGLIEQVYVKKHKHPWYQLTKKGQRIRELLLSAEVLSHGK